MNQINIKLAIYLLFNIYLIVPFSKNQSEITINAKTDTTVCRYKWLL